MTQHQWSEGSIARAIATQTLAKKCVVLVDRCNWTGHECDVLAVTTDLRVIDVEVKISRADLKADAKKDKWWHRQFWRYGEPESPRIPRAWPPKVWKHYYALPADIWKPELLEFLPSAASGVLLLSADRSYHVDGSRWIDVRCERRAKPNGEATRLTPANVMDIARLANLRMWDAYAQRDTNTRGRDLQHVLKAEALVPDATDRRIPVIPSPVGGPMGAGQPAAAGPTREAAV